MFNSISEIMPAVRILFSKDELLSGKIFPEDIINKNSRKEDFINLGYSTNGDDVLEISDQPRTVSDLKQIGKDWENKNSRPPKYILVKNLGAFVLAPNATMVENAIQKKNESLQNTEKGRLSGRIAIITGGAQGFGAGIAESLFSEGANIVIADLNKDAALKLVDDFNSRKLPNKATFVQTDVSNPGSVENLVNECVLNFGGLDVMISNAGILYAGGLDEMTPETFELMTKVNYTGYFNCAKYASVILKIQAEFSEIYFSDIIQINSKSGLKGSKNNFTYAGGKFGGIGLTQSFALELMTYRIKVNSICPGNFFDGPLWSDPERGLFVQYLKAGKVPGAKTIADVKRFYEQQVPAGRGCEVNDVAKAIFYAIEQEYETGQAIPVTGGQIMLN